MTDAEHLPTALGPANLGPPPTYGPDVNCLAPTPTYGPDSGSLGPTPLNSTAPPENSLALDRPPPLYAPPPYEQSASPYPPPAVAGGPDDAMPPGELSPPPYSPGVDDGVPADHGSCLFISSFEDKTIRRAFVRKVFSVVTLQLLVTFSVVCLFTFSATVKEAVQANIWVYLSSYIIFAVVAIALSFSSSFNRKHPWNLVGLTVVTLTLSYMVGTVASYHNTTAVVIAMGTTMVVCFAIIIFSAQTRVDFTACNGTLLVLSVILLMFGFFCFFFYSNVLQIVYGSLGAILYSVFLAVDCQLVMGRKKYSLSPEEYVFASLILYLDIVTIFLYLLILLGGSSSN